MSKLKYLTDVASLVCLVLCLVVIADQHDWIPDPSPTPPIPDPEPGPDPDPDPLPPVPDDHPFPSDGFHLLVVSEGHDQAKLITSTKAISEWPGLTSAWRDPDQKNQGEWQKAIDWCNARSSGQPYFILRRGNYVDEGALSGTLQQMHDQVLQALKEAPDA